MTRRDARRLLRNGTITAELLDLDRPIKPGDPVVLSYLDERLGPLMTQLGLIENLLPIETGGLAVPPPQTRKFPLIEAISGAVLAHGLRSYRIVAIAFDANDLVDGWVTVEPYLDGLSVDRDPNLSILVLPADGRKWTGNLYLTAYYDAPGEDALPSE